jgi:hypothetical protein
MTRVIPFYSRRHLELLYNKSPLTDAEQHELMKLQEPRMRQEGYRIARHPSAGYWCWQRIDTDDPDAA